MSNKDNNIHIRIELCKDKSSGKLQLMTFFDSNAPNFSKDKDGYFWLPTIEERDFLNESFELIPTGGVASPPPQKIVDKPPEVKPLTPQTQGISG